ncbi:MAG: hypothetical protein ABI183_16325 [Polyangiaceae bacterium]
MKPFVLFSAVFAIAFLGACSHDKQEAGALLHAIDQYRAAPDELKLQRAAEISGTVCSTPEICDTKVECLKMAEPTAKALAIKVQAAKTLAAIQSGHELPNDPNVKSLPDQLDEASRLLDEGHAELQPCEEKITGLRIKYRL